MRFAALICVCPLLLATVIHGADKPEKSWKVKVLYPQIRKIDRSGYVVHQESTPGCECRIVCTPDKCGKCACCKPEMVPVTYKSLFLRSIPASPSWEEAKASLKSAEEKATAAETHLQEKKQLLLKAEAKLKEIAAKDAVAHRAAKREVSLARWEVANATQAKHDADAEQKKASDNEAYASEHDLGINLPPIEIATHKIGEIKVPK